VCGLKHFMRIGVVGCN